MSEPANSTMTSPSSSSSTSRSMTAHFGHTELDAGSEAPRLRIVLSRGAARAALDPLQPDRRFHRRSLRRACRPGQDRRGRRPPHHRLSRQRAAGECGQVPRPRRCRRRGRLGRGGVHPRHLELRHARNGERAPGVDPGDHQPRSQRFADRAHGGAMPRIRIRPARGLAC